MHLYETLARRQGKSMSIIGFCKFALTKHPSVIVATNDQSGTLTKLREYFPKNLMDTVEDWGVRIHRMKE